MQLDELPGERQPESRPLDLLVRRAHLPELLEDRLLVLGAIPTPVSATEISAIPSFIAVCTSIRPPSGVNLRALESRFKRGYTEHSQGCSHASLLGGTLAHRAGVRQRRG